jgi:hypothetical protein
LTSRPPKERTAKHIAYAVLLGAETRAKGRTHDGSNPYHDGDPCQDAYDDGYKTLDAIIGEHLRGLKAAWRD